ncbi:hypothetical protein RZU89_10195 (plasmid) [Campylobacter coli]
MLKTKKEAENLANNFIKGGYSVDIGLMQFNLITLNLPHSHITA